MYRSGIQLTDESLDLSRLPLLFRKVKAAGFEEITPALPTNDGALPLRDRLMLLAEAAADEGVQISALLLSARQADGLWQTADAGNAAVAELCNLAMWSKKAGISALILPVAATRRTPAVTQEGLDHHRALGQFVADCGIRLLLENGMREDLLHLAVAVCPEAGFVWNVGRNFCFCPGTNLAEKYRCVLEQIHLEDNRGMKKPPTPDIDDDLHLQPLDGDIPWESTAKQFAALGIATLTSSARPGPGQETETFLADSYERLRQLRRMAEAH